MKVKPIVIAVLGIIIGASWCYFYQEYKIIRYEADQTWEHIERLDTGVPNPASDEKVKAFSLEVKEEVGKGDSILPSPTGIEEIIYEVAKEKKFEDPELLVKIAKAESGLRPCAKNPASSATGLYQILDMHGLTEAERCNPRIATEWAVDNFNGGRPWNSSRSKWDNQ